MSAYKQIKSLEVGQEATQAFLVASVKKGTTKAGKPYARITLKDKSGQITANLWNFDPHNYSELIAGVYARMTIEIEDYKGSRQAKSNSTPMIIPTPDDLSPYESDLGLSEKQVNYYYELLMDYKNKVKNIFIKTYLDVIFDDLTTQKLFKLAPASVSNRGAYRNGLLEHVYKVMLNAEAIIESQGEANDPTNIDCDIVIAGVLCHDLGKIYAYKVDSIGVHHTRSGLLLAHLPMSYGISVQAFIQAESVLRREIPEDIKDHINHLILSHHGKLEWGSPIKPQSIEAHILHMADMADSTTSCFAELTRDNIDRVDENGFIEGSFFTSRSIYVGDKAKDV